MKPTTSRNLSTDGGYLDGQLLVAMPTMTDRRFARSVIYLCAHSADGAMGLIINQQADNIELAELFEQLGILPAGEEMRVPADLFDMTVHVGGPVETGRGFVLHSADYFVDESTLEIDNGVCLTATIDILRAMASGKGPHQSILALGYAGWAPGQLESEIHANGWLHCPADPELVFEPDLDAKYHLALSRIGIDPSHLVSDAGHA